MDARLHAKRRRARERDKAARDKRVAKAHASVAEFLEQEETRLGPDTDADLALEDGSDDATVMRNVYIDGRDPPTVATTWQEQLEKRREMQEMMESQIDLADMRGTVRGTQRSANPRRRAALEEDAELSLNEHILERKLRAQAGEGAADETLMRMPSSTSQNTDTYRGGPPLLFEKEEGSDTDGYASSSDDSVFQQYTRTSAHGSKFSWLAAIGGGMFPDMSEEIVHMLLSVSGINYFYMNWVGCNRGATKFRYARSLAHWKMFVEETCAFVDHEWYDASSSEHTLELTFREFRRGELEEMKEARDKEPGGIIKHSVFPDYASDFLRAHVVLRPETDTAREQCVKQEEMRKITLQKRLDEQRKAPDFAVESELDRATPVQQLGKVQVEQAVSDYDTLMRHERNMERKLNLRKLNDVYQKVERMRNDGGNAVMRLTSVYLYWC